MRGITLNSAACYTSAGVIGYIPLGEVLTLADFTKDRFNTKSVEYETPQNIFDPLNLEFGFTVDVCATPKNRKCQAYFTKEQNGLIQDWKGICWCNPPTGREMQK